MDPQALPSLPIVNPATRTDEEIRQSWPCFGMAYSVVDVQCNTDCLLRPRCVARLALKTCLDTAALDAELGTDLRSIRVAKRVMRGESFETAIGLELQSTQTTDEPEDAPAPAPAPSPAPPPTPVVVIASPPEEVVSEAPVSVPETSAPVVHPKTKGRAKASVSVKAPSVPAPKPPKKPDPVPPPSSPPKVEKAVPAVKASKAKAPKKAPGRPKEGTVMTTATATKPKKKAPAVKAKKTPSVKRVVRDVDESAAFDRERLKSAFVAALKDKQKLPDVMYKGAVVAGPVVDLSGKVYRAAGRAWPTLTEYVAHFAGTKDYDGRSYCAYSVPRFFRPEASTERAAVRNKKKQESKVKAATKTAKVTTAAKPAGKKTAAKKAPAKKAKAKKKSKAK
jgi:hypothetical protein